MQKPINRLERLRSRCCARHAADGTCGSACPKAILAVASSIRGRASPSFSMPPPRTPPRSTPVVCTYSRLVARCVLSPTFAGSSPCRMSQLEAASRYWLPPPPPLVVSARKCAGVARHNGIKPGFDSVARHACGAQLCMMGRPNGLSGFSWYARALVRADQCHRGNIRAWCSHALGTSSVPWWSRWRCTATLLSIAARVGGALHMAGSAGSVASGSIDACGARLRRTPSWRPGRDPKFRASLSYEAAPRNHHRCQP